MCTEIWRVNTLIHSAQEHHKNSAENFSDDRAIDAFSNGLCRKDLVEELGRANPKKVSELMDIANRWADGEDVVVHNKRTRSLKEDRYRHNNQQRRQ